MSAVPGHPKHTPAAAHPGEGAPGGLPDISRRFLVRQWADGCVLFDRQSGNTHALDLLTFDVLEALQDGDNGSASVNAACHSHFPQSSADEVESIARECCERLEKCGLITAGPTR